MNSVQNRFGNRVAQRLPHHEMSLLEVRRHGAQRQRNGIAHSHSLPSHPILGEDPRKINHPRIVAEYLDVIDAGNVNILDCRQLQKRFCRSQKPHRPTLHRRCGRVEILFCPHKGSASRLCRKSYISATRRRNLGESSHLNSGESYGLDIAQIVDVNSRGVA